MGSYNNNVKVVCNQLFHFGMPACNTNKKGANIFIVYGRRLDLHSFRARMVILAYI